jgi:hypothetical protein
MKLGNSQRFRVETIIIALYAPRVRYSSALESCMARWLAVSSIAEIRSTIVKLYVQQSTDNAS